MDALLTWLVNYQVSLAVLIPALATLAVSVVALGSARGAARLANEATRESAKTAALVAEKNSERKILVENITQERAKWREKIRTKAIEVHKAAVKGDQVWLAELNLTFATSLHPYDPEDNLILDVIEQLKDEKDRQAKLEEFSDRISLLLKHDWQRAKQEAELTKRIKVERLTLEQLRCARAGCGKKKQMPCFSAGAFQRASGTSPGEISQTLLSTSEEAVL